MQDLHLLRYSIINTVTKYQNSIHGCIWSIRESNLDLWDGNRCFTDRLLKCLVARATKELTCIRALPETLQSSLTDIHPDNTAGIVQLMRLETIYGLVSFVVLDTLWSTFPYIFQATLFSTHPSRYHKPLVHPVHNPKRNQIFRLFIQTGFQDSILEPTLAVPYSKSCDYIIPALFKNYYIHQNHLSHNNNPHVSHST